MHILGGEEDDEALGDLGLVLLIVERQPREGVRRVTEPAAYAQRSGSTLW